MPKVSKEEVIANLKVERDARNRLTIPSIKSLFHALVDWSQADYTRIVVAFRKGLNFVPLLLI